VKRRGLVLAGGGSALTVPLAFGQTHAQPRRIGVLTVATEPSFASSLQALRNGLRELGHAEGRDITIEVRYAGGQALELPRLAAELAALRCVLVIATGAAATDAALGANTDGPVVSLGDLVAAGHAAQLGRPSGRVTGVSFLPAPLNAKRLEILAAVLPRGSVVLNLVDPNSVVSVEAVEATGRALGLVLQAAYASTPAQIEAAIAGARQRRVAGINVLNSPFLSAHHARIIDWVATARLPAIYQWPEAARDGGLMGYGPSLTAMFRLLAGYASRLLAGAEPTDLPIEQPTHFELVINLKTAKALALRIPQSLLLRADEVIR
jgi:putative tryptophan/tyrosine transport system substrate-binding protein